MKKKRNEFKEPNKKARRKRGRRESQEELNESHTIFFFSCIAFGLR